MTGCCTFTQNEFLALKLARLETTFLKVSVKSAFSTQTNKAAMSCNSRGFFLVMTASAVILAHLAVGPGRSAQGRLHTDSNQISLTVRIKRTTQGEASFDRIPSQQGLISSLNATPINFKMTATLQFRDQFGSIRVIDSYDAFAIFSVFAFRAHAASSLNLPASSPLASVCSLSFQETRFSTAVPT